VVVLIVFFPVAIAAAGAFRSAEPARIDLVRAFGGSTARVYRHVTIPGAVPAIFDGLRISAAYAVAGAAIAEQIGGARSGLGLFIARSQRSFRADQVLAGVVVIAALSLAVYAIVGATGRLATPWQRRSIKGPS
jgi:ABC-type nitrate/sulfonate/bicarbonate transport system permease component